MAYHLTCYETSTGRKTTRIGVSKPVPYGQKPYICSVCHKAIEVGQQFTWIPHGRGPGNAPEQTQEEEAPKQTSVNTYSIQDVDNRLQDIRKLIADSDLKVRGELAAAILSESKALEARLTGIIAPKVIRIEIQEPKTGEVRDLGRQHKRFPELLRKLSAGLNVWIAGPAGSGKSTAVATCAKALNKPFYYSGAVAYAEKLMGFMSATGQYVETAFFQAYTKGGLFCWDEVDASDPNALLAFQAAIENGYCDFPCGNMPKHPEFLCVATANTWGHGATADYCGRNKIDQAFTDRFATQPWEYDEGLEEAIAPVPEFTKYVQCVRRNVATKGIKVLVTPRASIQGGKLLLAGESLDVVLRGCVQKGMTDDQWASVKGETPKVKTEKRV